MVAYNFRNQEKLSSQSRRNEAEITVGFRCYDCGHQTHIRRNCKDNNQKLENGNGEQTFIIENNNDRLDDKMKYELSVLVQLIRYDRIWHINVNGFYWIEASLIKIEIGGPSTVDAVGSKSSWKLYLVTWKILFMYRQWDLFSEMSALDNGLIPMYFVNEWLLVCKGWNG